MNTLFTRCSLALRAPLRPRFAAILVFCLSGVTMTGCRPASDAQDLGTDALLTTPVDTLDTDTATFLALSDVHLDSRITSEGWCPYHLQTCETSPYLWEQTQTKARTLIDSLDPGFILYLGDLPAHNITPNERQNDFKVVLEDLRRLGTDTGVSVLYLPGNNDAIQCDYCTFTDAADQNQTPLDSDPGGSWPVVHGQAQVVDTSGLGLGYYSAYPLGPSTTSAQPTLRAILLNTVIFTDGYRRNVTAYARHAQDQIDWLQDQLADARTASERVLLAMHVPPGIDGHGANNEWSDIDVTLEDRTETVEQAFLQLVDDYEDIITGLLTGHTHTNGIRRIHNCDGTFVEMAFSVPGITTDHGNNPGMTVFTYTTDAFELIDKHTYYAAESASNPEDTDYWANGGVLAFRSVYDCATCSGTETLYDHIKTMTRQDSLQQTDLVFEGMSNALYLKPGKTAGRFYREALDVSCPSY